MENDTQTFRGSLRSGPKDGPFSMRSAAIVTIMLTLLLWWLPVFGQIVAGYMGGRRAGSAVKGFAVSSLTMIIFVAAAFILPYLGLSISESQGAALGAVAGGYPEMTAFVTSTFSYVTGLFETFGPAGSEAIAACAVTAAFGTVGGIAAGQMSRESAFRSASADIPRSMRSADTQIRHAGQFGGRVPLNGTQIRSDASAPPPAKRPEVPIQAAAAEQESPFASLLQMSDRKPAADASAAAVPDKQIKEDLEYV